MSQAIFILLLCICLATSQQPFQKMNSFGMNKPHLLFQLGQRTKVGTSYGFGYWQNYKKALQQQHFSNLRLSYQTTQKGLYVDMLSHDGDSHIHQKIEDSSFDVTSQIKYQMLDDGWQQHIKMTRQASAENKSASTYWMQYITVQNTDHNLVQVFDTPSKTPKYFQVVAKKDKQAQIKIDSIGYKPQKIVIKSSTPLKLFGFSMNISESYDVKGTMEEIKYLIELERYSMKKRKNDSSLVNWQDQQLDLMRNQDWIGHKFVVLVFYGEFKDDCDVYIGNRSRPFQKEHFQSVSQQLDHKYFNIQTYPEHSAFLKHILYNLYGGIAFYQGGLYTQNSLIRHEFDSFHSFTPSRLIFPRGFLWDDGFHLSVAVHYNPSLTINMLKNWIKKIDLFGWIGREQIRGFQMSSLMPQMKFIYQDTFEMNPPTLILPILTLIEKIQQGQLHESNVKEMNNLLSQNFWKLQKWYRYFLKTQSHNNLMQKQSINKTTKYRWRCKDDCERGNFMGSGLDDYPRVQNASQLSKQHVDLMSWIYFFSQGLEKIATYLNQSKPAYYYHNKKLQMAKKIYDECLDEVDLIFKDQIVKAKNQFVDRLVTKIGYISLFPFFVGVLDQQMAEPSQLQKMNQLLVDNSDRDMLVDNSDRDISTKIEQMQKNDIFTSEQRNSLNSLRQKLFPKQMKDKITQIRQKVVQIMMDPDQLLSQDGIRSLSISDPQYGTLDNYWRGAVWMPINYLILRACKKYYKNDNSVSQLYTTLRQRLIETVKKNWHQTGYLYQNYHKGKGNRGYPFYGWSSLIAQIITQQY